MSKIILVGNAGTGVGRDIANLLKESKHNFIIIDDKGNAELRGALLEPKWDLPEPPDALEWQDTKGTPCGKQYKGEKHPLPIWHKGKRF